MKINKIAILVGLMILGFASQSSAMEMSRNNAYEILGLQPNSSEQQIKKAYYSLAKRWHTDKNDSLEALEMIQKINRAYGILIDKEELPKEANFSQSFSFDSFFGQPGPEIYNNQFVFPNFYAAMQEMENKLQNTVQQFSEEFQYNNKNSNVISSKTYKINDCELVTENFLEDGSVRIEVETAKTKSSLFDTTTFYTNKSALTVDSNSIQLKKYRALKVAYERAQLRNSLITWTVGVGIVTGAAYLWVYHPEKVVAFKNDVIIPGFTKISNFAKSFYAGKV